MAKIIRTVNDIELEMLDCYIYRFITKPVIITDMKHLDDIERRHKNEIEKQTGLKVIYARYDIVPNIKIEAMNLLPIYYLIDKE